MDTGKLIRLGAVAAPVAFFLAVLSGMFVPIYTDEVAWRIQERAGIDGVDKLTTLLCGPSSLARPPWWMMPIRHYSAFWNLQFSAPLYTRISGIFCALLWGLMLARLIVRAAPDDNRRRILTVLAFSLITIGLTPWLLVWSRPEQPILLCLTGAILVSCSGWKRPEPRGAARAWWHAGAIVLLAAIAVAYHLKAIFFFPVFITCLVTCTQPRRYVAPCLTGATLIIVLTAHGASYWIARLKCPVNQALLESQSFGSALLSARSPGEALHVLVLMAQNVNPLVYIARTVPRPNPMSAWLTEGQVSMPAAFTWWVLIAFVWCLALLFAGEALAVRLLRIRGDGAEPRSAIASALVLSILGWSATQAMKNDYEATLIVPLLLLAIVMALSCPAVPQRLVNIVRNLSLGGPPAAICSMLVVACAFAPSLATAYHQRGYIERQQYSISAFGYEAERKRIHGLARRCGIDPAHSQNLVLDDYTYYAFMRSHMPDHAASGFVPTQTRELTIDYLRARQSSGYIASCKLLPRALQSMAKRDGDICCLAPTWNAPPTPPVK